MLKIDIAVVGGFASTNVGNDYFSKCIHHALSKANPDKNIVITQNLPGYYWKENNTNPQNSFNYLSKLDIDYLVLTGPLFDVKFPSIWTDTLDGLKKKGTRILILSAGSQKYDENEQNTVRAFLKRIEPYALVTRDSPTYEAYNDLAEYSYDGIDFAFFINDVYRPYKLDQEDYVILNFDTMPEPRFEQNTGGGKSFTFLGEEWTYESISMNKIHKNMYRLFPKLYRYHNKNFGRYSIIRPYNYVNPGTSKKLFSVPNTYVSELAYDHINLYANSCGILSCRVHSCLASLVFGKEAMLFSKTLRGQLFDRVGLEKIRDQPITIDPQYLMDEKGKQMNFLKKIL